MPPRPPPHAYAQAAAVFLLGCGVIAYTTLDISRSLRANSVPVTPQQQAALDDYVEEVGERQRGGAAHR